MRPQGLAPKGEDMSHNYTDIASLEELRESGDYEKIAGLLGDSWQSSAEFDSETVRRRLIAAELAGRNGRQHILT